MKNNSTVIKAVLKGQIITWECQGGFIRGPAPSDGIVVEDDVSTKFIAYKDVNAALNEIKQHRRKHK